MRARKKSVEEILHNLEASGAITRNESLELHEAITREHDDDVEEARENSFAAGQLEPDFRKLCLLEIASEWFNSASVDEIKNFTKSLNQSTIGHLIQAMEEIK